MYQDAGIHRRRIEGIAERQHDNSSPSLKTLLKLNGKNYDFNFKRPNFDDLTPCYPNERISLEIEGNGDISIRAIDLLAPIGKGQRGLIVAPPKAGKTTLLKKIANSIEEKHKDIKLIILLIILLIFISFIWLRRIRCCHLKLQSSCAIISICHTFTVTLEIKLQTKTV